MRWSSSARCCGPGVAAAGFLEPNALELDANALLHGFARRERAWCGVSSTGAPVRCARIEQVRRLGGSWPAIARVSPAALWSTRPAPGPTRLRCWPASPAAACSRCGGRRRPFRVPGDLAALLPAPPLRGSGRRELLFQARDRRDHGEPLRGDAVRALRRLCRTTSTWRLALERFHEATIVPPARPTATWAGPQDVRAGPLPVVGFDAEVKASSGMRGRAARHPDLAGAFGPGRQAPSRPGRLIA